MTFVIKSAIDDSKEAWHNMFDTVPHYYLFNKSSSFMDCDIQNLSHTDLEDVLSQLENINPDLLEILNYSHRFADETDDDVAKDSDQEDGSDAEGEEQGNEKNARSFQLMIETKKKFNFKNDSPLHMAVCDTNTKLVNILLTYISKIPNKGTRNFSELFSYLVEYQAFMNFLEELPVQTQKMQMK